MRAGADPSCGPCARMGSIAIRTRQNGCACTFPPHVTWMAAVCIAVILGVLLTHYV